jgi:hypothetical protein
LALSTSDCYKVTRSSAMLQKQNNQEMIIYHRQLTVSALLMVTMLVLIVFEPILLPRGVILIN